MTGDEYYNFINSKMNTSRGEEIPFSVDHEKLFDFQREIISRQLRMGRSAIFADCGLGKTLMELVWASNVVRHTNRPVLLIAPLAVSYQMTTEAEKFSIDVSRSKTGVVDGDIIVTNYESLHLFDPANYDGVILDESSILKSFDGTRRKQITEFMKKIKYRLLATATAAPNDYTELGTSSEALGELGFIDMLNHFFINDRNNSSTRRFFGESQKWRFKGYAELPFWRWVTSWSTACRQPSDLGFDDGPFKLPELIQRNNIVQSRVKPDGMLFDMVATTLPDQRAERRRTINERCEKVAELVDHKDYALVWCHLNDEGNILERLIPDSIQVSGKDGDDAKEQKLAAFANGEDRVLVSKPKIGAWGLNFQHCNHVTFFPSHSYEQYYQSIRRCWRFGQKRPVTVDIVMTPGDERVMMNMQRKADAAVEMFSNLVAEMNNQNTIEAKHSKQMKAEVPSWI